MVTYEHMPVSVSDKRIVVVGGTSDIGQAIALGFASEGADVLATSRRESAVDETANAIEELGVNAARGTCDVADPASLERVRERAVEEFGDVNVVAASQGTISCETVRDIDDDAWDHVTDIALGSICRMTQELAPIVTDGGSTINISSLAARLSTANLPAYSAAKGGVEALTRASAREFAPEMRVNAIASGFVIMPQNADTYVEGTEKRERIDEQAPLGRVAEREEIVGTAVFLASDASSFVTGEVVTADGGLADSAF